MTLDLFWLLGLIAIGGCTFLFARAIPATTTKELEVIRIIAGWGVFFEFVWLMMGGLYFLHRAGL